MNTFRVWLICSLSVSQISHVKKQCFGRVSTPDWINCGRILKEKSPTFKATVLRLSDPERTGSLCRHLRSVMDVGIKTSLQQIFAKAVSVSCKPLVGFKGIAVVGTLKVKTDTFTTSFKISHK